MHEESKSGLLGLRPLFYAIAFLMAAFAANLPGEANALQMKYTYEGIGDSACLVETLGGVGDCRVSGSFILNTGKFGETQHALDATFSFFVNDTLFDEVFFPPIDVFEPAPFICISFCNEVETDTNGVILSLDLSIHPPSSIANAIFLSGTNWSWDGFESGNGWFAGGSATITQVGAVVPLPAAVWFLLGSISCFFAVRRKHLLGLQ